MEAARHTYESLRRANAPLLLAERAARTPDVVAYRAKVLGVYRERTWRQFRDLVADCAAGFKRLGLEKGERVAIMGDACEEWTICDLAAQAAGAVTYGLYPTASISEVKYQMEHGGASIFVAENQEYVDKILPLLDQLPNLKWVVVVDMTAMFMYENEKLVAYDEVLRQGAKAGAKAGGGEADFLAMVRAIDPRDPALIIYTSGTTGNPKGALIAHGAHLAAAFTFVEHMPILGGEAHRTVAFLPLGHIMGRDMAITFPLFADIVPHYGEDLADLPRTFFEVAPTILMVVPRYLQKFASQILVAMENSTPLKKAVYRLALDFGRRFAGRRWTSGNGVWDRLLYRLLHFAAFRPILNKLGFDRLRLVISGGAPLPEETMALWQIYGVNVVEVYGQTETAGAMISGQEKEFARPGDVGSVPHGWRVELNGDGEILVKGDDMFQGYWRDPAATSEVIDADGWLHTGDVGAWRDGNLRIIDRARDFMITSGGKTISPAFIENILRSSPYISEAAVFGDKRKYVTALIEIDYDTVSDWARSRNVAYTGFTNLTEQQGVLDLLRAEIEKSNRKMARVEQIKAFRILPKMLDPEEEGEPVTPTRKIKRSLMYEKFAYLIEGMYESTEEEMLAREVGDILGGSGEATDYAAADATATAH